MNEQKSELPTTVVTPFQAVKLFDKMFVAKCLGAIFVIFTIFFLVGKFRKSSATTSVNNNNNNNMTSIRRYKSL